MDTTSNIVGAIGLAAFISLLILALLLAISWIVLPWTIARRLKTISGELKTANAHLAVIESETQIRVPTASEGTLNR
jgi:uncharacterized protein YoxC